MRSTWAYTNSNEVNSVLARPPRRGFSDTHLPCSGAFFSLKMPSPSLTMFPRPFLLPRPPRSGPTRNRQLQPPLLFPRQDALLDLLTRASPCFHLGAIDPARNQSTLIPTPVWFTVSRLFFSVSPGRRATSGRVGSLSSLRAEAH